MNSDKNTPRLLGAAFLLQAIASCARANRLIEAAGAIMLGNPLPSMVPVASNVIFIALFVGLAIWRFDKTEF